MRSDNELTRSEKIANLLANADPSARAGMIQSYRNNPNIPADLLAEGLDLAKSLGVSTEPQMATQAQITDLYRQYLGREPDAAGLKFYSNPDFSLDLIRSDIANSAEAQSYAQAQAVAAQRQAEIDAREAAATAGAGVGAPTGVTPTSNLLPADIAWLSQGKGMFGNPLYDDPTSPITLALQAGIGVPGTDFLVSAASNALGLTEASMIAQDAKSLANAGLTEDQIISTLQASGVPSSAAVQAAGDAASGASTFDIAQNISGTTYKGGTTAATSLPSVPASTGATSGVTGTPVQVTGTGGLLTTPAASAVTGATGLLGAIQPSEGGQVQVTGTTQPATTGLLGGTSSVAPAVTAGATTGTEGTQTVNLQAKRIADVNSLYQTILGRVPDAAGLAFYSNPDFTLDQIEADLRNSAEAKNRVNVTGSTATTGGTSGVTSAVTGATTAGTGATQTVPVEDRTVPKETSSVLTPVSTGVVTTPRGEVPVTTYNVPTTQTTITNNPSISLLDQATIAALLAGVGGLLNQDGETTPTVSQDYINSIINAPRPTYGTAPFVPGVMPGVIPGVMPGTQSNVYAPFGGSMGYGAGRFGATVQPFALPGGLLGTMGRPATPSGTSLL